MSEFTSPEDAALELDLPLLGTLPSPESTTGAVAASFPHDIESRREYYHAISRALSSPLSYGGSIGLVGDVESSRRAHVAAWLAAAVAAERTVILVDADLRGAHLSFDERGRAQEGLVDVLRYGVRSPRVVSPTRTPGLNLLPVGSGTLDLSGTFGSGAVPSLFEELQRTGDLIVINGPSLEDFQAAAPFLTQVSSWILLHELGVSDSRKTRTLRQTFGREKCVGVVGLVGDRAGVDPAVAGALAGAAAGAATIDPARALETDEADGVSPVVETQHAEGKAEAGKKEAEVRTAEDGEETAREAAPRSVEEPAVTAATPPSAGSGEREAPRDLTEQAASDLEKARSVTSPVDGPRDGAPTSAPVPSDEEIAAWAEETAEETRAVTGKAPSGPAADSPPGKTPAVLSPSGKTPSKPTPPPGAAPSKPDPPAEKLSKPASTPKSAPEPASPPAAKAPSRPAVPPPLPARPPGKGAARGTAPGATKGRERPAPAPVATAGKGNRSTGPTGASPTPLKTTGDRSRRVSPLIWIAGAGALAVAAFFFFRGSTEQALTPRPGGRPIPSPNREATSPGAKPPSGKPASGTPASGSPAPGKPATGKPSTTQEPSPAAGGATAGKAPGPDATTPATTPPAGRDASRVTKPATEPPVRVEPTAAVGTAGPVFYVHVSSVNTEAGSRVESSRLRRAGFPTATKRVDLGKRGIWWRVYLGPYGIRADAEAAGTKAKTSKLTDYTQIYRLRRDEVEVGTGQENR